MSDLWPNDDTKLRDLSDSERLVRLEERLERLETWARKLIVVAKIHPTGRLFLRALGIKP